MASTYTTSLRLNKQGQGDNRNSWGTTFNSSGGSDLLDEAIAGYVAVAMADANQTLTTNNGATDQARNPIIRCTGANTAVRTLTIPTVEKWYIIDNSTTGGFAITVSNGVNTLTVPAASSMVVYTDGTTIWNVNSFGTSAALTSLSLTSTDAGASAAPTLDLYRDSASPAALDELGVVVFSGEDSGGGKQTYAQVFATIVDPTAASEDGMLKVQIAQQGTVLDKMSLHQGGMTLENAATDVLTINTDNDDQLLIIQGGSTSSQGGQIYVYGDAHPSNAGDIAIVQDGDFKYSWDASDGQHEFYDPVLITGPSNCFFQQSSTTIPGNSNNTTGACISTLGAVNANVNGSAHGFGKTSDGTVIVLSSGGSPEGSISISGATVSYNAFMGAHWSQTLKGDKPDLLRGTIVESLDEMCEWGGKNDERLPRFKVSDTQRSRAVYGVFGWWDDFEADKTNDAHIASLGAYFVRIRKGQKLHRGDLIESNGDGCGRVQDDDIMRASTVAKVTSITPVEVYPDGSFLVPCTLHCG